jgi:hypothetical protein
MSGMFVAILYVRLSHNPEDKRQHVPAKRGIHTHGYTLSQPQNIVFWRKSVVISIHLHASVGKKKMRSRNIALYSSSVVTKRDN